MQSTVIEIEKPRSPIGSAPKTEFEKAFELGRWPIQGTRDVYLCGQCRIARIEKDQGVCWPCDVMLRRLEDEQSEPWWMSNGGILGLAIAAGGVFLALCWLVAAFTSTAK